MSEVLSQMMSGPVKIALYVTALIIVALYLVCILWVAKDARSRRAHVIPWVIVAIIPIAGVVAYFLLRPDLTADDSDEQSMQLNYLTHELGKFGECPHCGYAIEKDFVSCPHCRHQLRNVCSRCGRVLEPDWSICPYCTTPVAGRTR